MMLRAAADAGWDTGAGERWAAVFVSNADRAAAIWAQRAGDPAQGGVVVWDYHVIAVRWPRAGAPAEVWDLDTTVRPFPCAAGAYAREALHVPRLERLRRRYRVVPADEFLATFASDRSHMLTVAEDGTREWQSPPPPRPPIRTETCANNLESFIDTTAGVGPGCAMDEREFLELLLGPPQR